MEIWLGFFYFSQSISVLYVTYMQNINHSYPLVYQLVREDNPRALASGLFPMQVDNHGITSLNHLHNVDIEHFEIVRAKIGKVSSCINIYVLTLCLALI